MPKRAVIFYRGIAIILSIITLMGVKFGMDTKLNTAIGLLSLSFAVIPIILVGWQRIRLCTSDNFIQPVGSSWENKCIWIGVDAKKYCDAFNHTVLLCFFALITCIMQCLYDLPLKESRSVIQVFVALWYVWVIVFLIHSIRKVNWRSYMVISILMLSATGIIKPIVNWTFGQIRTVQMFIFNSVLLAVIFGIFTGVSLWCYYYRRLAQCITTSVYLTRQPNTVKLVAKNGTIWDRSEILFYPDFNKAGVKLTFYDGKPSVFYEYKELKEYIVKGNGKVLELSNGK